jgi:hypothetical protein
MDKIDLIIDALESFSTNTASNEWGHDYRLCCGSPTDLSHTQHCRGLKSLAAARELRELKPVAWVGRRTTSEGRVLDGFLTCDSDEYGAIPVYILDEVTK